MMPLLPPPSIIPVQFKYVDEDNVEASIFKTKQTSIKECKMLLEKAIFRLKVDFILYSYELLEIKSNSINYSTYSEILKQFNGLILLAATSNKNETMSICVYILMLNDNKVDEKTEKLRDIFQEYFNKNKLIRCMYCNSSYMEGDDSKCIEYYHPGKRIPLESGLMEKEIDIDGETKLMVNFTCCGNHYLDEPGCQQKLRPNHVEDYEISELIIENEIF